jgi:hypothetical protein
VIGWTNERAIGCSTIYIYNHRRCIFEETPRSWGAVLQIHSSNVLMNSYLLLHCVTDKEARLGSDRRLDFGVMIPIPSSNGQPTSWHPLLLWVTGKWARSPQ